ncbi:MAG: ribonuclease H-like domain-containing protein, partial [Candidatus Aminicenantes bacterium]|nr:ribonuclease H-like domain-containing protein [Candidatus Aminicenantes bacterium]
MSDISVKLKRLKKEKSIRSRSKQVKDAWSKIDQESGLSTKEKLEQLLNLQREAPSPMSKKLQKKEFEPVSREPFEFIKNSYSLDTRYGQIKIGSGLDITSEILTCLSKETEFQNIDLSTALFLDLETTGLSGGTGVIPFLIGLGYYRDDKFWVMQYFLNEIGEEEGMLTDLTQFLNDMDFHSIVTYNGKVFDIPLLETRFIINRLPFPLNGLPHLDFLFPARRLWS